MECKYLTAIIDVVKLKNADLQIKYQITRLARTIMNMKSEHNSSKVQINAFTRAHTYKQSNNPYNSSTTRRDISHHCRNNNEFIRGTGFSFKYT